MESTINERLVELIKTLKMSNLAFAKSIDKSSTTINKLSDGGNKPSYDVLESIFVAYPNVSRDWLLMGEGEMFRIDKPENKSVDGGAFGAHVLADMKMTLDELKQMFEEELRQKNQQIAGMQRTIDALVGKSKGVPSSQVVSQGIRTNPLQVTLGAELGRVFKKFGS